MEQRPEISDIDQVVGEWLAVIRISRVISLERLASQTGISVEWLAALESGLGSATLSDLVRIGAVLEADILTILLPALIHAVRPSDELSGHTSWALELNRCAHGIHDPRAQALLLRCADALFDRQADA